nr:uncharacterized protein LOC119164433 [Rhipicephalus microplus]
MCYALALCFLLGTHFVPLHLASSLTKGTQATYKKCLTEATVENCETILLSWSYNNETNECEKGFVCYDCLNRFDTFDTCFLNCNTVSVTTQKPKKLGKPWFSKRKWKPWRRGCKYWLMHGACCQEVWLVFEKSSRGKTRRLLVYTGCRYDMYRIFAYDFSSRKCYELKKRPRAQGQQPSEKELELLRDRKRGCQHKTSNSANAPSTLPEKPAPSGMPPKPSIASQISEPTKHPTNTAQKNALKSTLTKRNIKSVAPKNQDKPT